MAIKIINKKPRKNVVKQCVCGKCGVTLEYTPADVTYKTYKDYGGGSDRYAEFNCLSCNQLIQICQ